MTDKPGNHTESARFLKAYSLEMTTKDVAALQEAAPLIPPGASISVTFLPNETIAARVAAAALVRKLGFVPVPHISARRIGSEAELRSFLGRLRDEAGTDHAFVIAGDPAQALGPYEDALAIIRSGLLYQHGVRRVGVSGYPEGHPQIAQPKLWQALHDKRSALQEQGLEMEVVTQFAFDADPIIDWLAKVRQAGVDAPVRIGVPGPANVQTLLRFAAKCGVGASAKVMSKYGLSITRMLGTAGPDRFIGTLAERLRTGEHGEVFAHLYPFGGFKRTAEWTHGFLGEPQMRFPTAAE